MHTKEPWEAVGERFPIQSPQGNRIGMTVIATNHHNGRWESIYCHVPDDAARIVACVNALAGIADPAALRAALEELRDAHNSPAADGGEMWYSGEVRQYVEKVAKLLPPETP